MAEYELTPTGETRYDGYMDPSSEQSHSEQSETSSEMSPGPVSEATRSLLERANSDTRETEEPDSAKTDGKQVVAEEAKRQKRMTRDNLVEIAQTVQNKSSVSEVLQAAEFVSAAAKMLEHNIKADIKNHGANEAILKDLEKKNVLKNLSDLENFLKNKKVDGDTTEQESSSARNAAILGKAPVIAQLALAIADYYKKATLSKEYNDPFKQIVSFEELMTNFNITLSDDRFKPGGEFSLLDVEEYVDEFGRELSKETAHPENFLRWVDEKAWFYHDFDPMAPIKLFEGMYIFAGTRKISIYEMLVDFPAYFAHRESTQGELKVLQSDLGRAHQKGNFQPEGTREEYGEDEHHQKIMGYYKNIEVFDEEAGKVIKVEKAYVSANAEEDQERHVAVLPVYYYNSKGEAVPVHAELAAKEQWGRVNRPDFEAAQEEILYRVWLMGENHNYDVAYRQDGMPSEAPLKEVMAKIYSDNKFTRTRDRLLRVFKMPTTTHREEDIIPDTDEKGRQKIDPTTGKPMYKAVDHPSEAQERFKGKSEGQGSLGKAVQRSLAAYYHISEANAAYEGYGIDENFNPFVEMLQGKDVDGAEIFYKSMIQRNLLEDKRFGYTFGKYDQSKEETWGDSKVEVEFLNFLNNERIARHGKLEGTFRERREWEKTDLVSLTTLSKSEFLEAMRSRHIDEQTLKRVFEKLKEKYTEAGNNTRLAELKEFEANLSKSSAERRKTFAQSLVGKAGISEDAMTNSSDAKKGFMYKFLKQENQMKGLDVLAIGLFVKSFPAEFSNDINPFINIRYSLEARERMRRSMRDTLSYTEKLDKFDAKWAEEWAYTFTFWTGISARNDMLGIGHDAWSKVQNTEWYRLRQSNGGNYPGNLDNLYGIHRLGTDFWQGLKVQMDGREKYDKTLYEVLTGLEKHGDAYSFNINKDVGSFEFPGNAQRQFYADHVSHAIDLFIDLTQKQEMTLDKLIEKRDNFGRLIWNNEAMQKMIDSTWKHLRYGFDNNGFLYDNMQYSWLYDEKISDKGQVKRTPKFGFMTLRESMFSEKVGEMNMYAREDNSSWSGEDVYHTKMARNVFAYLIAAQLREHTRFSGGYRIYSAEEVEVITEAFLKYASRVMQGKDGETIVLSGFFNAEEIMRILVAAHAVLWQLYLKEFGISMGGGFLFGFFDAFGLIMKQLGAGIKL